MKKRPCSFCRTMHPFTEDYWEGIRAGFPVCRKESKKVGDVNRDDHAGTLMGVMGSNTPSGTRGKGKMG